MLTLLSLIASVPVFADDAPAFRIHSATDIAHEFSFYFDGRFGGQYVIPQGGADCRIWGTLSRFDASNVNLLVLNSGATPCPYTEADIAAVRKYLEGGGGVVVLGDFCTFREETDYQLNALAKAFGAEFGKEAAKEPLKWAMELEDGGLPHPGPLPEGEGGMRYYGGKGLIFEDPDWHVLIEDAEKRPLLARKMVGKGTLLISSRGLCGRQPDAKDPINAWWWQPLLRKAAEGKAVDGTREPEGMPAENVSEREGLAVQCSDYMQPYGDVVLDLYKRERPVLERIMGVPPAPGMLTHLILLATGGGGFSGGNVIGLGVFWGDFPEKLYGMVELLAHEGTHSWVLPFPEPMWNEGIATYVGICTGREMGVAEDAEATLKGWIEGARKHDPEMNKLDIAHGEGIPHVVAMAKPMWIFEELRKERPDVLARYFQAKRRLIDPAKVQQYSAEDSVAVLSVAMGRDLFPWFQSLGVTVDKAKTSVAMDF